MTTKTMQYEGFFRDNSAFAIALLMDLRVHLDGLFTLIMEKLFELFAISSNIFEEPGEL